jgi:HAE1 family hydrophobic/amphiphilic exporter-1
MAPLEVSQAEAQVAQAEEDVIVAEQALHDTEDRLRRLLGFASASPLWKAPIRPVNEPAVEELEIDVDRAIQRAHSQRPDVRRARQSLDIDQVRLELAKNRLKPQLDFSATLGSNGVGGTQLVRDPDSNAVIDEIEGGYGDSLDQAFGFDFRRWIFALDFSLPLFNQSAEATAAQATLNLRRDEDVLAQRRLAVAEEVRGALRETQTARKRIEVAGAQRQFRDKALEAESKKFEHGLSTNFEVLNVQQDLTEARTGELQALADYLRALTNLRRAMGDLLTVHEIVLEPVPDDPEERSEAPQEGTEDDR